MKKYMMCFVIVFFVCSSFGHIGAEENDENENLDLNTEDLNKSNQRSLTDENGIPLFTSEYKEVKQEENQIEGKLFTKQFPKDSKKQKDTSNLFHSPVIMNEEFMRQEKQQSWEILIVIGVSFLLVAAFIGAKLRFNYKSTKGKVYDINI